MRGKIELQSVKFAYPERPKIMVFQDFDLVVDAGKTVALCGQSGSGKSSIVALILRFYDPMAGAVSLYYRSQSIPAGKAPMADHAQFVKSGCFKHLFFQKLCKCILLPWAQMRS